MWTGGRPRCPDCGNARMMWWDIAVSSGIPSGAKYKCPNCGAKYTEHELRNHYL